VVYAISNCFIDLAKVARAAKAHGSLLLGQLNHPGRQGLSTVQPHLVSASDVPLGTGPAPVPLTQKGIDDLIKRFAYAAEVLYHAGFDGVEVSRILVGSELQLTYSYT
jgi:2,4-dienoyl-CoA reductase-like NADH-dependent reductase (Old Yellow Enzyme family)